MPKIKKLNSNDEQLFRQLISLFQEVFDAEAGTYAPLESGYIQNLLASNSFAVWVALEEGLVVGGVTLRIWQTYTKPGKEGYIYDLGVSDKHRRKGIGKDLIATCIDYAKSNQIYTLWVQTESDDTGAVAFYSGIGLVGIDIKHYEIGIGENI